MQISPKFKILLEISQLREFKSYIPPFFLLNTTAIPELDWSKRYIVRSSLREEASSTNLNSGKSLSIKGITSQALLDQALQQIKSQVDLADLIIQEEFLYEDHLTIYCETELVYVQINHQGNFSTLMMSRDFVSGSYRYEKKLMDFLDRWRLFDEKNPVLMELGISSKEIKLFQINLVNTQLIKKIFNDDLLAKMISCRPRKVQLNLWQLIKREYGAYRFRQKCQHHTDFSTAHAFENWSYLLHYFYLYCRLQHKIATSDAFCEFLQQIQAQKNVLATNAWGHLLLARKIRGNESEVLLETRFNIGGNEYFFIGNGIYQGKVNQIVWALSELNPDVIYQATQSNIKDLIIITPSNSLLSHGFLAAVECSIPIVANVDQLQFNYLNDPKNAEDLLTIDFSRKEFVLKSL